MNRSLLPGVCLVVLVNLGFASPYCSAFSFDEFGKEFEEGMKSLEKGLGSTEEDLGKPGTIFSSKKDDREEQMEQNSITDAMRPLERAKAEYDGIAEASPELPQAMVQQLVMAAQPFTAQNQIASAAAQPLSANIMRRVNTINDHLDKAEEQISGGRAEHAPSQLQGAKKEYENIHNYYRGSFDPDHPTLVAVEKRMADIEAMLANPGAVQNEPVATQAQADENQSILPASTSTPAAPAAPSQTTDISPNKDISKNIRRRLKAANVQLDNAFKNAAEQKGNGNYYIDLAKKEYNSIFQSYEGRFNTDHPELVAVQERIKEAENAVNTGVALKNISEPIENNPGVVSDMPAEMGEALLAVGRDLQGLEQRLVTAESSSTPGSYANGLQSDLQWAESALEKFNEKYGGKFNADHVAYVQLTKRLEDDKARVARIDEKAASIVAAQNTAQAQSYSAEAQKIMAKYPNQPPTSTLHQNNIGRTVWASEIIGFKDQDRIKIKDTFRLSEPIFGRAYFTSSIGNTPVYGSDPDSKPSENYEFRYVWRLFINGEEQIDKFTSFVESKLNGEAGETWTTFQFAPNPVPFDQDFRNEAEAWRRVTQKLPPGRHKVRFELWGFQGSRYSREPITVGRFSLIVEEGDRVAAGSGFPEDIYQGSDIQSVKNQMINALVGPVAKARNEILKVSVTSNWRPGIYTDSKNSYRKISGTILWHDKNNDGVCRFTTVTFISDQLGTNSWKPLRFSALTGGPEGDSECP